MSISSIGSIVNPYNADASSGWKRIPASAGIKKEDLPLEVQEELATSRARVAEADRIAKDMEERSKLETVENKVLYSPNVSTLTREQALKKIETMREMIQSGESEQIRLQTGYGEKTTNNYRQYVYWLQQHVKELEGAQSGMDVKV
jgi:ERCC4-type nuclease